MSPLVRAQGLEHVYTLGSDERVVALRSVDLVLEHGEFIAIIGPNGSGKSTLARHLNALLLPTSGKLWIAGLLTTDPRNLWSIRQKVGMVFQNPDNQFVASTVEEDVAFGPENQALPTDDIRRRVDSALETVGLADRATYPPQMLSGGQKQLVAIAGALAAQPECLVLDEPTSMLDPIGRRQVLRAIHRLNAELGMSIVLITQSMEEAATAQRILVMHGGTIVLDGPPRQVFKQQDRLKELSLGLPPAVEIAHRLRDLGCKLPPGLLTIEELAGALC